MAIAMQGLSVKPNYEGLINVDVSENYIILHPQIVMRLFFRNCFVLNQSDGEGMRVMHLQQEQAMK